MKKSKLILAVIMIIFLFTACGKTQKMPVLLPDRADIISIGVSDGEKSAVSPNTEKEATEFIDAFYAVLADMETTNKESVTDVPTNKDYIMINLNCDDKGTTLFYYKKMEQNM